MADVLLVEDDPHQRAYAALVLGEAGHAVREAQDGSEALRLARQRHPDLIVCDVVMPGMNGYQFVTALRQERAICTTPVILLTSLSERAQVRVGMNAGADDYLPKPFKPAELVEAADALLRRRRSQYEAIAGTVLQDMDAALEQQRQQLATRYEHQLLQELNSRWKEEVEAGREVAYDNAGLLVADLFTVVERECADRPDAAQLLQRAHQAASDALYLFGAVHVLHHGQDIVAVFRPDTQGRASLLNPVRAAFGLIGAVGSALGGGSAAMPAVGVALGPVSVLRLHDPLHGDGGTTPVPGPTLHRAQALRALAREQGWQVAVPAQDAQRLPEGIAQAGRTVFRAELGDLLVAELAKPRSQGSAPVPIG